MFYYSLKAFKTLCLMPVIIEPVTFRQRQSNWVDYSYYKNAFLSKPQVCGDAEFQFLHLFTFAYIKKDDRLFSLIIVVRVVILNSTYMFLKILFLCSLLEN